MGSFVFFTVLALLISCGTDSTAFAGKDEQNCVSCQLNRSLPPIPPHPTSEDACSISKALLRGNPWACFPDVLKYQASPVTEQLMNTALRASLNPTVGKCYRKVMESDLLAVGMIPWISGNCADEAVDVFKHVNEPKWLPSPSFIRDTGWLAARGRYTAENPDPREGPRTPDSMKTRHKNMVNLLEDKEAMKVICHPAKNGETSPYGTKRRDGNKEIRRDPADYNPDIVGRVCDAKLAPRGAVLVYQGGSGCMPWELPKGESEGGHIEIKSERTVRGKTETYYCSDFCQAFPINEQPKSNYKLIGVMIPGN